MNETISWITDKDAFPERNRYVLIASGKRTSIAYYENQCWYHEDAGAVEGAVDAWAKLPHGPYAEMDDRIDQTSD